MSNFSRKAVAVGLALTTAAWLAGAVLPASAQTSAATIATLMAQIQALQAQLTALQGGSTGSSVTASYNYTRDLTVGSQGADVTALQQMLVAQGDLSMPAGVAYGYFGGLTKAALAKYQAANGIKPASGFFGPITRAYVAAHTSSTGTGTGTTGTGTVVPTGSGLAVSLASTNPVGTNIATGAVNQKMLSLNFTAGSQAVTVTSLQLVRGGLSQDSDLLNVYLYQGGQRLATNMGISNGVVNFNQASGLFTVPAGQTVTIDVTADIANASNTGHIITLSLASATSVTASAQVSGSFPITGNAMTIANVTLASLNFTNSSVGTSSASAVNVNAGQTHNVVGTFTLQAGSDPVKISSIRFTEAGSIPTQYLQNIQLWNGSTQVGGTLQTMNGNIAYFDLSSAPLMLAAGQTAALTLYADVTAGVGYYFQFTIQQSSDIQAVDTMYNVGIGATAVT
ncbi:peptidoglycan-binding protein, partial [Patescibacteria group bacterium]|nr:peptidoglycan-binding protein [Patescibacteria group bacterium]